MRIHHPHLYNLSLKVLGQLIFLCVLLTGLTGAQESESKNVSSLIDQLKHPDSLKRSQAAVALGEMGDGAREAVPQLIEALKDPNIDNRGSAAYALGKIGAGAKEAVPQLIKFLNEPHDRFNRSSAAIALGEIGDGAREAVPDLTEALKDSDGLVSSSAASALGEIGAGAKEAVPQLIEALKDSSQYTRSSAAEALWKIGAGARETVVPQLIEALSDPDTDVNIGAAEALAQLSTILAHDKSTEFSDQLNTAADIMRDSPEPDVKRHADRVQQASDLLKLLWWEQLKQWVVIHPAISLAIAAFPMLLLVGLVLLWLRPLWLLHINELLARTTDVKLPEKLGGFNVAPRYLILAGFFHYHSRVLDAWVTNHIGSARKMFSGLPTVEERKIYVPLPVVLGDESEADLSPSKLRSALFGKLICLQIWGEGGSGKTSLACRLAQWAMAPEKEARLKAEHLMLPVLVEQDLVISDKDSEHPLLRTIRQHARVMIGEEDPPPAGLLRELLKKRRVLVIIDGFSEMNEASRTAVLSGITDLPVNAVIITTRTDEQLGALPKTEIKPLRVKGNRLSTFMEAYLTARKKRDLFEDDEFFEACRRLSLIVGDRDVTALLAKLYAEQMIAAKEGTADAGAPENIPELMLSYLNDLSRKAGSDVPDIRVIHRAAKRVAWECLEKTLRPTPAPREDVLLALSREGDGEALLKHLEEKLKLVQTVGVGRDRIRFALDPLAEYLAGMHLVDELGQDEAAWGSFLESVDERGGGPEDIRGFLLAIRDCCLAKGKNAPSLRAAADGLGQRAGISPEESSRQRLERRVKQLIPRLKYADANDRANAAQELGVIGHPAKIAVKDLCRLLVDREHHVRVATVDALRKIGAGAQEAVPHLTELLKDPDARIRHSAAYALTGIGEGAKEAVPQLIEALKDPNEVVRRHAARGLGLIGGRAKEAQPHLTEALKDSDKDVRRHAAAAIEKISGGTREAST